jgi:hypothetical protein
VLLGGPAAGGAAGAWSRTLLRDGEVAGRVALHDDRPEVDAADEDTAAAGLAYARRAAAARARRI